MQLIEPSARIVSIPEYEHALNTVEAAIRVCKKSHISLDIQSKENLIRKVIEAGHLSTVEHVSVTVHLVTGRGTTHELVRHRIASFSQESSRFCLYSNDKFGSEISAIRPYWFSRKEWEIYLAHVQNGVTDFSVNGDISYLQPIDNWYKSIVQAEHAYMQLTTVNQKLIDPDCNDLLLPAQAARGILPTDLKTEIIMTANIRQWRHVFNLRVLGITGIPHPDIKLLLEPLLTKFKEQLPVFFEDMTLPSHGKT
jgi:thymidylate synthase (FAD)